MRHSLVTLAVFSSAAIFVFPALPSEGDALAIEANIQAKHLQWNLVLDPVFDSPTGNTIVGYSRCGDSALWSGAYLAAEAFRYKVTQSPDALNQVKNTLAGLKALVDVTGNNRLARCMFMANWQFAQGIENEEAHNTINQSAPWVWVDNTSRDEVVGVFFGLGVAYDMVDDPGVRSSIGSLANRISHFIANHQWSPGDDINTTFRLRPEELQMMLDTTRHVNPGDDISGPFLEAPFDAGVLVDIQSNDSYFKFNLDYMSFYNLLRYHNTSQYMGAYVDVRNYTANHQNPFFDIIDHALRGPNSFDSEITPLLDRWLLRPKRDPYVDLSNQVKLCGSEACSPVPVPMRPPTDFLWQRDPFQVKGGSYGTIEGAGIDYILPYWMGRYYGVIPNIAVQSAAGTIYTLAPGSIGSLYGANLASTTAQANSQPLPTNLGGTTVTITDSQGGALPAPLLYVSPTQINFVVPSGMATGSAMIAINNGTTTLNTTVQLQNAAPALFSANGTGAGVAAAYGTTVQVANPKLQGTIPVYQCGSSGCSSVPINLGVDTVVYVSLYGTGIRNASNVSVTINNVNVPVVYFGPAPGFTGLDQVNVQLDLALRGSGEDNVVLTADGQTSNTVTVNIQ